MEEWHREASFEAASLFGSWNEPGKDITVKKVCTTELYKEKYSHNAVLIENYLTWIKAIRGITKKHIGKRWNEIICTSEMKQLRKEIDYAITRDQISPSIATKWFDFIQASDDDIALCRQDILLTVMSETAHNLRKEARTKSFDAWKEKVKESIKKGTGYAFRIIKQLQQEKHIGQSTNDGKSAGLRAQFEKQVMQWKGLWEAQEEIKPTQKMERIKQINQTIGQCARLEAITAEEIRMAALSFKMATVYVDGWHPRQLGYLSVAARETLAQIWNWCEHSCIWPDQEENLITRLLPKPAGGFRPIMLFRSTFRVYSRCRKKYVSRWANANRPSEINLQPRRWITDPIWRGAIRNEIARSANRQQVAEVQWDLKKAFDNVSRTRLIQAAKMTGYPMPILRASIISYTWRRHLLVGPLAHKGLYADRGIAAGSAFAANELTALMLPSVAAHRTLHPRVTLSIHVDDIAMTARGKSQEVVDNLTNAAEHMYNELEVNLAMPIDIEDKGYVLSSCPKTMNKLRKKLGFKSGNTADVVKKLGIDFTLNYTVKQPTADKRIISAKSRMAKLKRLRKYGSIGRIFQAGVKPHALYGCETYPVKEKHQTVMRKMAAQTTKIRPHGVPNQVRFLAQGCSSDPVFHINQMALMRWIREVWLLNCKHTPEDVLSGREIVKAMNMIHEEQVRKRSRKGGPIRAVAQALNSLQWEMKRPFAFVDKHCTVYDIICIIILFGMISFAQERLKIPSYMISYAIS
jgi:hypothetical protein